MGRHDHLHEVLGSAIAALALDQNLVDFRIVQVADGPLDQVAFFIDRGRGHRLEGQVADLFPQAQQVFVIAPDFGPGPLAARRADDQACAFRHVQFGRDVLELLAVGDVGDLAADAAAARGVGHQDAIASRQRQIGGQRGALVAALLLDDLDQHDLPDLDHFLDLVAARTGLFLDADFLGHVLFGDRLDFLVLVGRVGDGGFAVVVVIAGVGLVRSGILVVPGVVFGGGIGRGNLVARFGALGLRLAAAIAARRLLGLLRLGIGAFLGDQGRAVGGGDLVIIRVDFREGQKAVAVSAVIHKGRLQRGFDPRDLGQIDVARNLALVYGLEIKFFDLGSVHHDHPSFLGMGGVDQHFLCHVQFFRAGMRPAVPATPPNAGCDMMGTRARQGLRRCGGKG